MKKIINGKLYNTDTAEKIGEWSSNESRTSFYYFEEELYRKKTGEYFLYGYGHAASPYAERIDTNTTGAGERILPLTVKDAKEWAERKLDADEYMKIFGDVSEDGGRTTLTISLSNDEAELIRRNAREAEMSISAYVIMKCAE